MSVVWIDSGRYTPLPSNAVDVGADRDGQLLYVGRAFHEGNLLPAKINPTHSKAYVCWAGSEYAKENYEVLCYPKVGWQYCDFHDIPENAIVAGYTKCGEKLYLGRAEYDETVTPGKIQPSHKRLYIPYNGEEVAIEECEIMTTYY